MEDFIAQITAITPSLPFSRDSSIGHYDMRTRIMDYWADYRFKSGRTCYKSLNWPNWSETGMGAVSSPLYAEKGFLGLTTEQGLSLLEESLACPGKSNLMPCLTNPDKFRADRLPARTSIFAAASEGPKISSEKSVSVELASENWLKGIFSEELRIPVEELDAEVPLGEMGVDSVILAGLTKILEKELGADLDLSVSGASDHQGSQSLSV